MFIHVYVCVQICKYISGQTVPEVLPAKEQGRPLRARVCRYGKGGAAARHTTDARHEVSGGRRAARVCVRNDEREKGAHNELLQPRERHVTRQCGNYSMQYNHICGFTRQFVMEHFDMLSVSVRLNK